MKVSQFHSDLIPRFIEKVWNQEDFLALPNYLSSNCVIHESPRNHLIIGRNQFIKTLCKIKNSVPDAVFSVESQRFENETLITHWLSTGSTVKIAEGHIQGRERVFTSGTFRSRATGGLINECWWTW